MKKLCFVVQRYGMEVNGGAELLTRQLAEKLIRFYDIEVLTSKAIDYQTWKDEYAEDETVLNGVRVRRFSVASTRSRTAFTRVNNMFINNQLPKSREREWLEKQGPFVPELIEYIRKHKNDYDLFLFFTYLYYPTAAGITEVADKAILVPFAHDEPFIKMHMFKGVFRKPAGICYMTTEEKDFIQRKFWNYDVPYAMGGAGVDVPEVVDAERFKKKYGVNNYIVYAGRIDDGKNCPELFSFFQKYKKAHPSDLKLILMGKPVIPIPEDPDIMSLGFVSEEDKFDGIAGSQLLVLPSKFESLSIVVLEAFYLHRPVLVNGECEVLKGHIEKSHGGYYYHNYTGFASKLTQLTHFADINREMGDNGYRYVMENYRWDIICRRMKSLIDYAIDKQKGVRG